MFTLFFVAIFRLLLYNKIEMKTWYNNGKIEKYFDDEIIQVPDGFVLGRLPKETNLDKALKEIPKERLAEVYLSNAGNETASILGISKHMFTQFNGSRFFCSLFII